MRLSYAQLKGLITLLLVHQCCGDDRFWWLPPKKRWIWTKKKDRILHKKAIRTRMADTAKNRRMRPKKTDPVYATL